MFIEHSVGNYATLIYLNIADIKQITISICSAQRRTEDGINLSGGHVAGRGLAGGAGRLQGKSSQHRKISPPPSYLSPSLPNSHLPCASDLCKDERT